MADTYFGKPPGSVFKAPGTYITPQGGMSVGGPQAVVPSRMGGVTSGGGGYSGGQTTEATPTPSATTGMTQASIEQAQQEMARAEIARRNTATYLSEQEYQRYKEAAQNISTQIPTAAQIKARPEAGKIVSKYAGKNVYVVSKSEESPKQVVQPTPQQNAQSIVRQQITSKINRVARPVASVTEYTYKKLDEAGIIKGVESGLGLSDDVPGFFTPFKIAKSQIKLGADYLEQKGGVTGKASAGVLDVGSALLPGDVVQLGVLKGYGLGFKYAPKILSGYFVAEGIKGASEAKSTREYSSSITTAALGGYGLLSEVSLGKAAYQRPELSRDIPREPFIRQRATVIVEEKGTGNILFELDKSTGMRILPGGAIDKGETPMQAAKRELFEETGLKLPLKVSDIVSTEREKNIVFKAVVEDAKNIKLQPQAKEVGSLDFVKVGYYAGKTAQKPFGESASIFGNLKGLIPEIRAEDYLIASRQQTLTKFEKLSPEQKSDLTIKGEDYIKREFGRTKLKEYKSLGSEEIAKEYFLKEWGGNLKSLIISREDIQIGKALSPGEARRTETFLRQSKDLFVKRVEKPSIKYPRSLIDYALGKKPGQFKKVFSKIGEPDIVVGFGSRYNVPFKELKKYTDKDLTYISAAKVPIRTGFLELTEKGIKMSISEGKISKDINKKFEVLKSESKRGGEGLYFQPATVPDIKYSEAYVGATYLGLFEGGKGEEGITFFKPKPSIYIKKGGEGLSNTVKGKASIEFEKAAFPGTVFKVVGRERSGKLSGKTIRKFDIELVKANKGELTELGIQKGLKELSGEKRSQFLKRVKQETGRDYISPSKEYISPSRLASGYRTSKIPSSRIISSGMNKSLLRSKLVAYNFREPKAGTYSEKSIGAVTPLKLSVPYKYESYGYRSITPKKSDTYGYDYRYEPSLTKKKKGVYSGSSIGKYVSKGVGYDLFEVVKGKPRLRASGLSKQAALDIGTRDILGSLKATLLVKKGSTPMRDVSTGNEFARYRNLFREPTAKSRYRKYGAITLIQKERRVPGLGTGRLTSRGEKLEIQRARRNKLLN